MPSQNARSPSALSKAGCKKVFEDKVSGTRADRPGLAKTHEMLREGDTLVVWKLDRLSRSLKDLLHIMDRIETAGSGFRSLTEAIDTTTAAGRMMMQMVGSFAEFERAMIRERTVVSEHSCMRAYSGTENTPPQRARPKRSNRIRHPAGAVTGGLQLAPLTPQERAVLEQVGAVTTHPGARRAHVFEVRIATDAAARLGGTAPVVRDPSITVPGLPVALEGGANVFKLEYFGQPACLA